MLIRGAEVSPGRRVDVRLGGGSVVAMAPRIDPAAGEPCIDARECILLPGLHDHHMHLLALAASRASVNCGPPGVNTLDELATKLYAACVSQPGAVRGIGYHEGSGVSIDRHWLDSVCSSIPVRIQHRSGRLWILNSAALAQLQLAQDRPEDAEPEGIERDASGALTGRFYHLDDWLRQHLPAAPPPLAPVSRELASFGVTGITDAGPDNDAVVLGLLEAAQRSGDLRQRVLLMGTAMLPRHVSAALVTGPQKIYLREPALPGFDDLCATIQASHATGRSVAFHCVTRTELQFALAALDESGALPGDRIEHASVADDAAIAQIAAMGLTVVTQPNFVFERGDQYLSHVEPEDLPVLYRGAGFLRAGAKLAAGTDAPFGDPDPWLAMRSALERRTRGGQLLGAAEALTPDQALALFTGEPADPARARRIQPGAPADLCLLRGSWRDVLSDPHRGRVWLTICGGAVIWDADRDSRSA